MGTYFINIRKVRQPITVSRGGRQGRKEGRREVGDERRKQGEAKEGSGGERKMKNKLSPIDPS